MNEHPRIFVVSSYMHAFVVRAPRIPEEGETVFGTDSEIGPGGKGQNQAIAAARLGAQVEILASVGSDSLGDEAQALWEREGLGTRWVRRDEDRRPTGMAFIIVDERGQNRIIVTPGANAGLTARSADEAEEAIAGADALIAQFESPIGVVERALQLARKHGVKTILNPAPAREVSDSLLSLADVITPNEAEVRALIGSTTENDPETLARALRRRGPGTVVLTLGEMGAYVLDDSGGRTIPGVQVDVVDTTGAGDAFTGALAVALARGLPMDEAVRLGNLGGAFCVTRPGVVPGLGRQDDLLALSGESGVAGRRGG
ncbi:MAG TPA: ribokinase [Chloroflexota bacterium]